MVKVYYILQFISFMNNIIDIIIINPTSDADLIRPVTNSKFQMISGISFPGAEESFRPPFYSFFRKYPRSGDIGKKHDDALL